MVVAAHDRMREHADDHVLAERRCRRAVAPQAQHVRQMRSRRQSDQENIDVFFHAVKVGNIKIIVWKHNGSPHRGGVQKSADFADKQY